PYGSTRRPCDAWPIVMASAAYTDGCRYVIPAMRMPIRTREVCPDNAASVVCASKHSPGPSPYIGWKWSNPQTPSKPSCSANCARATTSWNGTRCWAMSRPNRIGCRLPRESLRELRVRTFRALTVDHEVDALVVQRHK